MADQLRELLELLKWSARLEWEPDAEEQHLLEELREWIEAILEL